VRPRISRRLRWPGVLVCAAIALVWFLSLPFNTTISPWGHTVNLCNGGIDLRVFAGFSNNDWSIEVNSPAEPMRWWFACRVYDWSPLTLAARFPLWAVFAPALLITIAAWRAPRFTGADKCPTCGYDLSGSRRRPCPECGNAR
jgi:hypothetical protein